MNTDKSHVYLSYLNTVISSANMWVSSNFMVYWSYWFSDYEHFFVILFQTKTRNELKNCQKLTYTRFIEIVYGIVIEIDPWVWFYISGYWFEKCHARTDMGILYKKGYKYYLINQCNTVRFQSINCYTYDDFMCI